MIELLAPLARELGTDGWILGAVFLRVGAMAALLPAFGEASIPARIKLGVAFAFTAVVFPFAGISMAPPEGLMPAAGLIVTEVFVGLVFGVLLRLFVMGLQVAGSIAAQSTSLSQIFGGSAGTDPQPAMGNFLTLAGLTFAVLMGLHLRVVEYIVTSYQIIPFGGLITPRDLLQLGVDQIAGCFALGFALAGPFVLASVIYNVTLGAINRAMPQLMVAFVGAPAITAGGLVFLALSAPYIVNIWHSTMTAFLAAPWEFPQ